MSNEDVSGKTQAELEELKAEYYSSPSTWSGETVEFEEAYCLAKIPNQPDDYDGPPRYCVRGGDELNEVGDNHLCKHHGGNITPINEQEDVDGINIKHGVRATQEHLRGDFDDKDRALYDWIVKSYSETYDLNIENNPGIAYDLHRLAVEVVRAERARGHLVSEGEVNEEPVRGEDGRLVTDENGHVVTEKSEHYLAQMLNRQDKKITKFEKELGITRKEKLKRSQTDDAIDAVKGFTELGSVFLDRDSKDFDPDDKPWESENE